MVLPNMFDEVVEFIANNNPKNVLAFKASERSSKRYEQLVFKEKSEGLNPDEKRELEQFQILEHIMRRAKAKARLIIAS